MHKSTWIALLVVLNVALLAALCLCTYSLPAARAQGTGLAGNYMVVAGEVLDEFDALYVIDMRERMLNAFYWDRGRKELVFSDWRDLEKDFRANRD